MGVKGTIQAIAEELTLALKPFFDALKSPGRFSYFMRLLGWNTDGFIPPVKNLESILQGIDELGGKEDLSDLDVAILVERLSGFFSSLRSLSTATTFPDGLDGAAFRAEFPKQLRDYLITKYLITYRPLLGSLLQVLGVIRANPVAAEGARLAYTKFEIAWDDLGNLLNDPTGVFTKTFRWGNSDFNGAALLRAFYAFGHALGFRVQSSTLSSDEYNYLTQNAVSSSVTPVNERAVNWTLISNPFSAPPIDGGVRFAIVPETRVSKPGIAVLPFLQGSSSAWFPLSDHLAGYFQAAFLMSGGIAIRLYPGNMPTLEIGYLANVLSTAVDFTAGLNYSVGAEDSIVLIGSGESSRLEARSISVRAGTRVRSGSAGASSAYCECELLDAALIVSTSSADAFLAKVVGKDFSVNFNTALGLDSERGFYFTGSGGLEIQIPIHMSIGPVEIQSTTITIRTKGGSIPIELTTNLCIDLSVIKGAVEGIGISATFEPKDDGNLGPFQLDIGFKPPKGIGVTVNSGIVKGGGYLFFDNEKQEYAGALELTISEVISVKAIGLLTTRMPNGTKGFSLLVILTAQFGTPIQLGMGFALVGVGGMVGVNRAMRLQPLLEGVKTGAMNNILFPPDIATNAPKIFDSYRPIFAPEEGSYLVGPFLQLAWPTPALVTLSLGIVIEIPGDAVILGLLAAKLPQGKPLLVLQVAFAGVIEYAKKRLYFFATLFDSRICNMPLDGDMGVLAAFGDDPDLVITTGGFHPRFNPPALPFPKPQRLSLEILNGSNARIRAEGYFAITSNTVQFGARAELFFGFDDLKVCGDIAFDCLFAFSPFHFELELSSSLSVEVFGAGCFSISVNMTIQGPTPWRVHGKGTISLLLVDITVRIDKTWGDEDGTTLPPIAIFPLVTAEFERRENWVTALSSGNTLLVTLRQSTIPETTVLVHPTGTLRVSQRAIPLDLTLDIVGNQSPSDVKGVELVISPGLLAKREFAIEQFAAAQFQRMSDGEKLSRPAFQPMHGGVELGPSGKEFATARTVKRSVRYEEILIDTDSRRSASRFSPFPRSLFDHFLKNNSVARSPISKSQQLRLRPADQRVEVTADRFDVAFQESKKLFASDSTSFFSEAYAREYMRSKVAANPNLTDRLQVIPSQERAK